MKTFLYTIRVDTDTEEHADMVIRERVDFEEQYTDEAGIEFEYTIEQYDGRGIAFGTANA